MTIYLVCVGERGEGQSPVAALRSRTKAIAYMQQLAAECIADSYEGRPVEREEECISVGCDVFCVTSLEMQ